MVRIMFAMLMLVTLPALADDNGRVSFLESEVRNLKRDVMNLTRQVDELRSRPPRMSPPFNDTQVAAPASEPPSWLDAGKWKRLRPGMSELDVIASLGAPTSMREEDGARVLFYALEIGTSGFMGGSIKLREREVVEVRQPTLQ